MTVKLTDRASVKAVLREMTLEEKATLVTGASTFGTAKIERLGIPAALLIDAGGGVNLRQYLSNLLHTGAIGIEDAPNGGLEIMSHLVYILDHLEEPEALNEPERELLKTFLEWLKRKVPSGELPSSFPVNSMLASTWNPEVVLECARQVGKEASAFGVDMLLGTPCINIQRDPRGGRGFEEYSEDPYLITQLAPNYAIGVQEQGVVADVKHFAVNNQETNRQTVNEIVSERAMREIYLPGFKACVQKGKVKNVMTSYNWINGTASAHNHWLIEDVLRGEWGFDGYVVSDWGGVYDQVAALKAGNDLCMPGPRPVDAILEAVRKGELDEALLDKAVENILNCLAEMPVMKGRKYQDIDSEEARKVAYHAAAEGIVLLKNEQETLPLSTEANVSFYGPYSKKFVQSGVGSGRVFTTKKSSLLDSAREIAGDERVSLDSVSEKTDAIVVTVFAAGQEGSDRDDISLKPREMKRLRKALADARRNRAKLIVILNVAGPIDLEEIWDEADAILLVYFPGQEGARAAADILYGRMNPSGKLAQTFPKHLYDCPSAFNFPGENETVHYGEGIFVGYRYYDYKHIEPRFPFGHGLSYTTFELSGLELEAEEFAFDEKEGFGVSVKVTNTGSLAGSETVQLYLSDETSALIKPVKELKGFQKVFLQPKESRTVRFRLDKEALSSYDERLHSWVCEPGYFTVLLGTSSRDIALTARFRAVGANPYGYGKDTEYTRIAEDERAVEVLLSSLPEGVLTREDVKRQTAYVAFRFTLEDAYNAYMRPKIAPDEADAIFERLCRELSGIDVTDMGFKYEEKEIF